MLDTFNKNNNTINNNDRLNNNNNNIKEKKNHNNSNNELQQEKQVHTAYYDVLVYAHHRANKGRDNSDITPLFK